MRIWCVVPLLTVNLCLVSGTALGVSWQEMLDRADSLVAIGNLDSAKVVLDGAMLQALAQYGPSDSTVEVELYREGIPQSHYFRGYAEAESIYSRALQISEMLLRGKDHELARLYADLATIYAEDSRHADAKRLYEEALAILDETMGAKSAEIGSILRCLGRSVHRLGDYDAAEMILTRSLSILQNALGAEHPVVARALNSLAIVYYAQGKYPEAETIYRRALRINENRFGPDHRYVAYPVHGLARLCRLQGRFAEAESLYLRALSITERALGPEHPDVTDQMVGLAALYRQQARYAEAESLLTRAIALKETRLGPDHIDMAFPLLNLGSLYFYEGRDVDAESLFTRALAIRTRNLDPEHALVGAALYDLALVHSKTGKYAEAEKLYKRALNIQEKALGPGHLNVASVLGGLAVVRRRQGVYAEAEELYRRALAIIDETLGPDSFRATDILNNLACLYHERGNYDEAERLYRRVLTICEKHMGPEHLDLAIPLHNLAILNVERGFYERGEDLYRRALAITEAALGRESADAADPLGGLGYLYYCWGRYAEAEPLFRRAIAITEKTAGLEHPDLASHLSNLAELYTAQGRYEEAEPLYGRALTILERAMGPEHPYVAYTLEMYSRHCRTTGDMDGALGLAWKALAVSEDNFRDWSPVMSERDALGYSQVLRGSVNNFLSVYFDLDTPADSTLQRTVDAIISTKGQVSEAVFIRSAEMNMLDQLGSLADSLRHARTALSELYVSGRGEGDFESHREALHEATRKKERLEADLSMTSASYRNLQEALYVDPNKVFGVLASMPKPTVLVEYMRYEYQVAGADSSVPHYLVLILDGSGTKDIIDLGESSEIDDLVDLYREHMLGISSSGQWPDSADRARYEEINTTLYGRVWEPAEVYIDGYDLVLIAPDGGLNMISFAGLMVDHSRYLIERYPIHCLSSGRDLVRLRDAGGLSRGLLAFGDPDYDATPVTWARSPGDSPDTGSKKPGHSAFSNVRSGCTELRDMLVSRLPGTRKEVELISQSWESVTSEPVSVCFGREASEDRYKAEAPGSRVIHLATHGYFLGGRCQPERPKGHGPDLATEYVGENPLLLSGLLLAGANLHGEGADELHKEDGILTAEEVTAMNLTGTQLVVLSACETGLGEVKEGEGIYGLRRAFQMAGARTVISALWPVPDEATAGMMTHLYEKRRESIPETMRRIQLAKIKELRSEGKSDHPFTWAGFIAMGDWR